MRIDGNVSGLFFNLDFDDVTLMENKVFAGYDEAKLLERATWFSDTLYRCGGPIVAPADLIQDFYARV